MGRFSRIFPEQEHPRAASAVRGCTHADEVSRGRSNPVPIEEGNGLGAGTDGSRIKGGGGGPHGDAVLHRPQDGFTVVVVRIHIGEGIGGSAGVRLARGPPQEGHHLGTGALSAGVEGGGGGPYRIIGFNHNSGREGSGRIHFQLAKTALSGGTDICFTDGQYLNTGSSAAFRMNTSNTNSGGWEDSYMRNNICGTSKSTTSGRIMGAIPAELRNALKSVTKYTNNNGSSSASSAVTATTDYFFLLSEYEVFGNITYSNSYEANYQQQYAYYSAGNSKVKYRHNSTGSAARWWLRSPRAGRSYDFVIVYTDGTVFYVNAYISLGFAPCFCV